MEIMREMVIVLGICALMGGAFSAGPRSAGRRVRAFRGGFLCGVLLLLPLVGLPLFRLWSTAPDGLVDAWIVGSILFEISLLARFFRRAETVGQPAPARLSDEAEASI